MSFYGDMTNPVTSQLHDQNLQGSLTTPGVEKCQLGSTGVSNPENENIYFKQRNEQYGDPLAQPTGVLNYSQASYQ